MKRIGGMWPQITGFDNLWRAYRKARKDKQDRPAVARFSLELEPNLFDLRQQLLEKRYQPGAYRQFTIYDRKPRAIAAAPFRDRVVHHALMNVVEPGLDRRFIHDCYACRKGKGVHAAIARYQHWAKRYEYALKVDVRSYFPSIDHAILKDKLRHCIKDESALWLFDRIIDSAPVPVVPAVTMPGDDLVDGMRARSLPIGNLTSQFLGNLYLNDLDHHLKQQCGVRAYLRYVDDMVVLDNDKQRLWQIAEQIQDFLGYERLQLHPDKIHIHRTGNGVDVLGYRVFRGHIRLRRDNGYRYRRRLKQLSTRYREGDANLDDVRSSVAAWVGHARHADSKGLRKAVLSSVSFKRDPVRYEDRSRGSRRLLEQQTEEPALGQPQQEHHR